MRIEVKFLFAFILILLTLWGCKKDCQDPTNPDCSNYDPCYGVVRVSADFEMLEMVQSTDIEYETDTMFSINRLKLKPKYMDFESYTWLIGAEVLNDKVVVRGGFPHYQVIPITLIVQSTPNNSCFPDDNGIDTVTRYIVSVPDVENLPIKGIYTGSNTDEPGNIFTISVLDTMSCTRWPDSPGSITRVEEYKLKNLPNGCPPASPDFQNCGFPEYLIRGGRVFFYRYTPNNLRTFQSLMSSGIRGYCGLGALGKLDKNGVLTVEYYYDSVGLYNTQIGNYLFEEIPPNFIFKTFKGVKQ